MRTKIYEEQYYVQKKNRRELKGLFGLLYFAADFKKRPYFTCK